MKIDASETVNYVWGFVTLVIGAVITFYAGRRTRRRPQLCYIVNFEMLLDLEDDVLSRDLHLSIGDRQIRRISRSYIAIWNNAGDTIRGSDIVEADPLKIALPSDDVAIEASVVSVSRSQNQVVLRPDPNNSNCLLLDFDFLDANDGAILKVVHEGLEEPRLVGTLRGAKIRPKNAIELTSKRLEVAAHASLWRRFKATVLADVSGSLAPQIAPVVFIFLAIFGVFILGRLQSHSFELLDPSKFDFSSPAGQDAFATEVRARQNDGQAWIGVLLVTALVALVIATVVGLMRRPVPLTLLTTFRENKK